MSSQARTSREEERRFSIRTLLIASVASATAAIVTSQFWKGGTPIAAAVTPVIVTIVSEMLHRPTEKIATRLTTERDALPAALRPRRSPSSNDAPAPLRELQEARETLREEAPRVPRSQPADRRRLPVRAIAVTAALAIVIGVAILTLPELIAGQSLGGGDSGTTIFGGDSGSSDQPAEQTDEPAPAEEQQTEPAQTQPEQTTEEKAPAQPESKPPSDPPAETETAPPTTTPSPPPAPQVH